MRKLTVIFLLLIGLNSKSQDITTKKFWTKDKVDHSIYSFGLGILPHIIITTHPLFEYMTRLEKRAITVAFPLAFGILKELVDSRTPGHVGSLDDMKANIVGIACFQLVITIPNRNNYRIQKF